MAASSSSRRSRSSSSSVSGTRWRGWSSSRRAPTSERALTAASSRLGWFQTSLAARAPVRPEAPATSTRVFSLTKQPPDLHDRRLDQHPDRGDLLIGQRAVRGAELEGEGDGLPALADLFAVEEVEDGGRAEQVATGLEHGCSHSLGAEVLGNDDREVL